jgi:hypothetical protein
VYVPLPSSHTLTDTRLQILVLQVAFNSPGNVLQEEPYLVAIWAVALCTIVSPVVFGVMVKRFGKEVGEGRWGMVS